MMVKDVVLLATLFVVLVCAMCATGYFFWAAYVTYKETREDGWK